ncbi:uncharacterized protein LOC134832324 [Culicoides brevitarsis]|uniref:uncharacterized protein LOC134832324 n=1 Tax=Culicoides brevitarsis TaxID=469753 RepID=UPI00307B15BB
MMNKMGSMSSEADDMADQLMKDTEMAMNEMDDEVMTIVQETGDLATNETLDVMDAMKNEIMNNQANDMMVEDIEGSNDSTQEMTDTATPEEAAEIKADATNDNNMTAQS